MRLSAYAKTPVRPLDFWAAVMIGATIVIGIGLQVQGAWHAPDISHWFCGGALLVIWTVAVIHLARYGRRAFPWPRVAALVGYTLFATGRLWVHHPPVLSWASSAGLCMVMAAVLAPYFVFGKRGEDETAAETVA